MNKAQDGNAEITWLSVFYSATLVKMSCHRGVIVSFNVMEMTLESGHYTIFSLTYILDHASSAGDKVNFIFTLAVNVDLAVKISIISTGSYFATSI